MQLSRGLRTSLGLVADRSEKGPSKGYHLPNSKQVFFVNPQGYSAHSGKGIAALSNTVGVTTSDLKLFGMLRI